MSDGETVNDRQWDSEDEWVNAWVIQWMGDWVSEWMN